MEDHQKHAPGGACCISFLHSVTSYSAPFALLTRETPVTPVFANAGLDSRHVKLKKKAVCMFTSILYMIHMKVLTGPTAVQGNEGEHGTQDSREAAC